YRCGDEESLAARVAAEPGDRAQQRQVCHCILHCGETIEHLFCFRQQLTEGGIQALRVRLPGQGWVLLVQSAFHVHESCEVQGICHPRVEGYWVGALYRDGPLVDP